MCHTHAGVAAFVLAAGATASIGDAAAFARADLPDADQLRVFVHLARLAAADAAASDGESEVGLAAVDFASVVPPHVDLFPADVQQRLQCRPATSLATREGIAAAIRSAIARRDHLEQQLRLALPAALLDKPGSLLATHAQLAACVERLDQVDVAIQAVAEAHEQHWRPWTTGASAAASAPVAAAAGRRLVDMALTVSQLHELVTHLGHMRHSHALAERHASLLSAAGERDGSGLVEAARRRLDTLRRHADALKAAASLAPLPADWMRAHRAQDLIDI
jgi:hypothetical protein